MSKYIDADLLKAEIDKRYAEYRAKMKTYDFTYYEGMADALDLFEQFLDTLPEQPVEGLEEAAWDCVLDSVDVNNPVLLPKYKELLTYLFKAGAEWQKKRDDLETADLLAIAHLQGMEQQKAKMLEDAVEGEISVKFPVVGRSLISVIDMPKDFKYGDKVRVIVIKEDEK